MTSILVFPVDSTPAVWVVYGGSRAASNPLHSGLRYGQAPAGTFEATPAAALQVGTEYEVLLNHWTRKCSRRSPSPANMEESDAVR
jgi:phage gp37-like protein